MTETKKASIKELRPDDKNINQSSARGGEMLRRSLQEYGAARSLVADKNMRIVAGNQTLEAAAAIGLDDVVVVPTDGSKLVVVQRTDIDLDTPRGRELAIADNRTNQVGYNPDPLMLAWHGSNGADLDKFWLPDELAALDLPDVDGLDLGEEGDEPIGDADAVPEVEDVPTSKRGDFWILGEHRVLCGDSRNADDVARLMNGNIADAVITDPPYGVSYAEKNNFLNDYGRRTGNRGGNVSIVKKIENDHLSVKDIGPFWKSVFSLMFEHTKKGGTYYMTGPQGGDLSMMMMMMQESGWLLKHVLIWVKNNHVFGRCDYNYKHEPILYGWKPGAGHYFGGSGSDTSVWNFDRPLSSKLHPTMKPVELIEHAAERALKPGEIVLDPFLGSGSTLIAAEETGRKCYGMEISPQYVDVIVKRWQDYTGKDAKHEDGRTFAEVSQTRLANTEQS